MSDTLTEAAWALAAETGRAPVNPDTTQGYLAALRRLATDARPTADQPVQDATDTLLAQLPARLTGTPTPALERVLETALTADEVSQHTAVTVVARLAARLVQDHPRADLQRLSAPLADLARAGTPRADTAPTRGVLALNTVLTAAAIVEGQRGNPGAADRLTKAAAQTRAALQNPPDWAPLSTADREVLDTLHYQVANHVADLRALDAHHQPAGPWLGDLRSSAEKAARTLDARVDLSGAAAAAAALQQTGPAAADAGLPAATPQQTSRDDPRPDDPRITGPRR